MSSHPEVTEAPRVVQARLESPRVNYATPGLWPGGITPFIGGQCLP